MTVTLIRDGNRILLGMKKRGFGMGRYNGFGGKIDEGETIEKAAKREVFEEASLEVKNLEKVGVIDFFWQNKDDHCEVHFFKVTEFSGEPEESEEMKPEWFDIDKIPLDKMWDDDKYWIPLFLDNKKFKGKFVFDDNDIAIEHKLEETP